MGRKAQVTQWFKPEQKPARAGWYQRNYYYADSTLVPDYFDGDLWLYGDGSSVPTGIVSAPRPWRGLANKPAGRKYK